jgi:hypothetical protein
LGCSGRKIKFGEEGDYFFTNTFFFNRRLAPSRPVPATTVAPAFLPSFFF